MAIKAVIFDCFGVLILPGRTLLYQTYPHLASQINDLEQQSDYGLISLQQFDNSIAELVGVKPEEVKTRYYDVNTYNESAIDWARELKSSGKYKIGMLSNVGRGWLNSFLRKMGQMDLFDSVVLSSDVGILKPDPRIFELMAKQLGVQPNECVMIDDIAENIDGASRADMPGIVFSSTQQAQAEFERLLEQSNA